MTQEEVVTCLSLKAAKRCALCKGLTRGTSHISDSGALLQVCTFTLLPHSHKLEIRHRPLPWARAVHRLGTWSAQIPVLGADMDRARLDASHSLEELKDIQRSTSDTLVALLAGNLYRHTPPQPSSHQRLKSICGDG